MGTRADFYVGRGVDAEWLGSTAWDGYPAGVPDEILQAKDEKEFRDAVGDHLAEREDGTLPEHGWPWPWDDSGTTDYAYAFDGGQVHGSCFGGPWFDPEAEPEYDDDGEPVERNGPDAVFPDMQSVKRVTLGGRSG